MHATIQECLAVYENTVREYCTWLKPLVEFYDRICGKGNWSVLANWGGSDYKKSMEFAQKLEAMELALGITKEESKEIFDRYYNKK